MIGRNYWLPLKKRIDDNNKYTKRRNRWKKKSNSRITFKFIISVIEFLCTVLTIISMCVSMHYPKISKTHSEAREMAYLNVETVREDNIIKQVTINNSANIKELIVPCIHFCR